MTIQETPLEAIHAEHFVTFFDSEASRATAVAEFVLTACSRGGRVGVLATARHWAAVVKAAGSRADEISRALADGSIQYRDAEIALYEISRGGFPDRLLFQTYLDEVLRSFGPRGSVSMYGELVDVLASRSEFNAAIQLEGFWNDVVGEQRIRLMCGYDATHFAPHGAESRLRDVCACHTETRMGSDDPLGRWLLEEATIPVSESAN